MPDPNNNSTANSSATTSVANPAAAVMGGPQADPTQGLPVDSRSPVASPTQPQNPADRHSAFGRGLLHIAHAIEGKQLNYVPDPTTGEVREVVSQRKPGGLFRDIILGAITGAAAGAQLPPGTGPIGGFAAGAEAGMRSNERERQGREARANEQGTEIKRKNQADIAAGMVAQSTVSDLNLGHHVGLMDSKQLDAHNNANSVVLSALKNNGGQLAQVDGNGKPGNGPDLMAKFNRDPSLLQGPEGFHRVPNIFYSTAGLEHAPGGGWVDKDGNPPDWNKRATVTLIDVPVSAWNKSISMPNSAINAAAGSPITNGPPTRESHLTIGSLFGLGLKSKKDLADAIRERHRAPKDENEAVGWQAQRDAANDPDSDMSDEEKHEAIIRGGTADNFLGGLTAQKKAQQKDTKPPTNVGEAQAALDSARIELRNNPSPENQQKVTDAQTRLTGQRQAKRQEQEDASNVKKTADESDERVAAQSLANGDATALKDIASLRGDQRLRIFAMAKKLNPNFNTTQAKLKASTLEEFTSGKQADQISSFNAFLGHAADASDITNQFRTTSIPLVNTPVNKIRKNFGDTTYTQFATALEPVRKEFQTFLEGGHALTESDKKAGDVILSDGSSPAQIQTALKQMGNTAFIRLGTLNDRYKRVMNEDYPDLLSEESQAAAAKLGLGNKAARYRSGGRVTGAVNQPTRQNPQNVQPPTQSQLTGKAAKYGVSPLGQ